ncbi:ROK family transcriptional regulator [Sporosarcina sp. YIM B06819]|uniref:ROK family transcriptional regulator n=1 Tax=Sporosarcina sp. YIM B06819 TaxID=3081769 RepID=UPI00298D5A31|nr:ROK family transcriptional regulator [Sporosarcina sp. YIM B06819]
MRQTTWNQHIVKKKNKEIVLQAIIKLAPLSRAEIAQQSGLNKATVSSLVSELIDEELIYESGIGESSGGRRPVILLFNEQAGYSLGVDIGVNYTLGVVTDLVGNVIYEVNQTVDTNLSSDQQIQLVIDTVHILIKHVPESRYGVIGIGIGVPGIVDNEGKVLLAPNLKWKDVDLLKILEAEFDYPILVENEANAGAYGEKRFGAGQKSNNLIYISAGIGIGVGIILNGELYRGINGFSGESGHMTIVKNGRKCNCGSSGCWEAYASEHALLKQAKEIDHLSEVSLGQLIELANNNDKDALKLFQEIGCNMSTGITNLIKTFNPQLIIIGNRLAKAEKWIKQPIITTAKQELLPFHKVDMNITFSELSSYSAALGVSAFTIEEFLKIDHTE